MRKKYLYVLICFLVSTLATANAANRTITGVVISGEDNEPLIGASVYVNADDLKKAGVSQTSLGTITDMDGKFSISIPEKVTRLHCSYIGFEEQNIILQTGKDTYRIVLQASSHTLGDVVVTGYQELERRKLTAAIAKVDVTDGMVGAAKSIDQALAGQIAGVSVTTTSGAPGAPARIRIRGTGSIGDGSVDSPLILIDGIEGDLNSLNPNDVESVSVLKDAASASIYGSRAAFGVILVTTKSGKAGKVKVNYSGDIRFSTATQVPKMANSLQFATYFNTANINAGGSNIFSDETMANIKKYMNGEFTDPSQPEYWGTTANVENGKWNNYGSAFANTDWFEEFYKKNVPSTQHNLSLSGGTEKFNWSVSGSFCISSAKTFLI